ncbi:hypothetical protein BaRGS_00016288 [Batillaria attramentaria]|uniref:Uncharacterized protein n=1 Tax=Batillaria attramentaria TaxID=370345 RepID=A0ABD0KZX7_9CAEN
MSSGNLTGFWSVGVDIGFAIHKSIIVMSPLTTGSRIAQPVEHGGCGGMVLFVSLSPVLVHVRRRLDADLWRWARGCSSQREPVTQLGVLHQHHLQCWDGELEGNMLCSYIIIIIS